MSGRDIIVECEGKEACVNVEISKNAGRQIILDKSDPGGGRIVFNKLQDITNDELSMNDFTVKIKKFKEATTLKYGTELVRNLIREGHSLKTVKIEVVNGKSYTCTANKKDQEKARNGQGTDAIIGINIKKDIYVPTIDHEGKSDLKRMLLHITLAHELIHAYHIVNGISESDEPIKYIYEYPDGIKTPEKVDEEELYTMGVPGYEDGGRGGHITENKIRDEQGENIRIAYWIDD